MAKKYRVLVGGQLDINIVGIGTIDHWYPLGSGNMQQTATATRNRTRTYYAYGGVFKNFRIYASANTSAIDFVYEIFVNDVGTGVTLTIPAGSGAGWFENNVDEVPIVAGDYVQYRLSVVSGFTKDCNVEFMGAVFETSEAVTRYTSSSNSALTLAVNANPVYINFTTVKSTTTTLTDNFRLPIPATGYVRVCITIVSNGRTQDAELYLNINGTRSTSVFATIPAGATGFFVSDPIPINQGDIIAIEADVSGGTGSMNFTEAGIFYFNDAKTYIAGSSGLTILGNTTQRHYCGIGFVGANGSFNDRAFKLAGKGLIRNFYHLAYNNTATTNGTCGLAKNASNEALGVTVTAGVNDLYSDTSNSFTYEDGDLIAIRTQRSGSLASSAGVTAFEIVPTGEGGFIPQCFIV